METDPLISIVIPTYNRADLVVKTVLSCSNQTYRNIEIIVVDDGSIDNTSEVLGSLIEKDSRIKYFKKENEGLPKALNYGFKNARGVFLTWTSDDNLYVKDAIQKMVNFLLENDLSFVYCDYFVVRNYDYNRKEYVNLPDQDPVLKGNKVGPCFLYHREIMEKIGDYDPTTKLVEDYDYWIRISKQFTVGHLNKPLYIYNVHKDALSVRFSKGLITQIASILVRIKNNILDANKATDLLIKHIARKKDDIKYSSREFLNVLFRLLALNNSSSVLYQFYKIVIRFQYAKEIRIILKKFEDQVINFKDAKLSLKKITYKII